MSQTAVPSGRCRRALCVAGLLVAGLVMTASAAPAHAALARCHSDPIVFLSNGMKVDLTASLSTDRSNVKHIAYLLHVPAGVLANRVVYTAGELGHKEAVTVVGDATGPYVAESVADTYSASAAVDVQMSVLDQNGGTKGTDTASGQTAQTLVTQVDPAVSATSTPGADD